MFADMAKMPQELMEFPQCAAQCSLSDVTEGTQWQPVFLHSETGETYYFYSRDSGPFGPT